MKTDQLLREHDYHYHKEFSNIAKFAALLAGRGKSGDEILNAVIEKYGVVNFMHPRQHAAPLTLFGSEGHDFQPNTISQMHDALRMPVAVKGALMPDGHMGYGLPIGGVIALDKAVWPGGVGYDIACRVSGSIYELSQRTFNSIYADAGKLMTIVRSVSHFGADAPPFRRDHSVMSDKLWKEDPILKKLHQKAAVQLGTSGAGNHFVDIMLGRITKANRHLNMPVGSHFMALITHSGSRGVGHAYATHYIDIAEKETASKARGISKGYGWLDLDTDAGRDYWRGMNLMGAYAKANHELIHAHFSVAAGLNPIAFFENHHNFAWIENGMVVHRKGATPASKGTLGIIPGSVADFAYLVEGLGNADSLDSASHGAGRNFSRTEASNRYDASTTQKRLSEWNVTTHGIAKDESPHAYKPMKQVMSQQEGILISSFAEMKPVVVVMGGLVKSDDGD